MLKWLRKGIGPNFLSSIINEIITLIVEWDSWCIWYEKWINNTKNEENSN